MIPDPVLDLPGIRISDTGRVGPKVARLGQLAQAGWRVPDGYAVTVDALAGWLPAGVAAELGQLADRGDTARARELIEGQPLPGWLEDAVAAAHERLARRTGQPAAGLRVAVRSSALAEDGASASFAGQYATYLGVSGVAGVLAHIRKCWASGFTAHALEYRRRAGSTGMSGSTVEEHRLAVGVLELVDVRSAGVVFTMDPVSGDRDRLIVEANWGFGESVVSGQVTPDHWEVDRSSGRVLAEHVSAKGAWSVFDDDVGAVALRPLPPDLAGQASLSAREVGYLCQAAVRIEAAAGGVPQDVEWAIARGLPFPDCVYILQHRPETTWAPGQRDAAPEEPDPAPPVAPEPDPKAPDPKAPDPKAPDPKAKAYDPVAYALRNVFRVPGA